MFLVFIYLTVNIRKSLVFLYVQNKLVKIFLIIIYSNTYKNNENI